MTLSAGARTELLRLARATIERRPLPPPSTPELQPVAAAFVSLHTKSGDLRGCIGTTRAEEPLWQAVRDAADAAARRDPRFTPVKASEYADLHVEISVLSPMTPIKPEDVVVGTHGLYLLHAGRAGVFLPQVPTDWGWDRRTYLRQLCLKAGLPPDAWGDPAAELFGFTAEVFSEEMSR